MWLDDQGMSPLPSPMPANPSARAWQFLADVARKRREFIGLSQEELALYGGPKKSTVGKIENHRETSYSPRTQQQLEKALGWSRGAIRDILVAGNEYADEELESVAADYIEDELPDLTIDPPQELRPDVVWSDGVLGVEVSLTLEELFEQWSKLALSVTNHEQEYARRRQVAPSVGRQELWQEFARRQAGDVGHPIWEATSADSDPTVTDAQEAFRLAAKRGAKEPGDEPQ